MRPAEAGLAEMDFALLTHEVATLVEGFFERIGRIPAHAAW